jgi:beta-lactamase superfamily II metal-dependent hydrolase/transcriptional regulator CtsR
MRGPDLVTFSRPAQNGHSFRPPAPFDLKTRFPCVAAGRPKWKTGRQRSFAATSSGAHILDIPPTGFHMRNPSVHPALRSIAGLVLPILLVSCGERGLPIPTDPVAGAMTDGVEGAAISAGGAAELVVQVLDVGQGDATVITNGSSIVIVDGGSSGTRFGVLLDSLALDGATIDAVIVSHGDSDHASGLRAVFERKRAIKVDYFFDNTDPTVGSGLTTVRDSVAARVARGETVYRDTDDPCDDGSPFCTLVLDGGAKLHIMRPDPNGAHTDNRSAPVKLVGPDSASFTMWLAGDARYDASDWFMDVARYDLAPGMNVNVLKGQEHGNCRSLQPRYLDVVSPDYVTFSLAAENGKGLVNTQTLELLSNQGKAWYRTDQNGSITFRSPGTPGGGFTVTVNRGTTNMSGPHDEESTSRQCRWTLGPAAPSGLTATAVSTSRIDLGWSDNSTDEDGFRIERRSGGGSFAEIATVAAGVTSFSSTGLAASTLYEYRVRAYSAAGASAFSNTASATTESPAPVAPAAPSGLSAASISTSRIDLGWSDNSNDEDGFRIERRSGGGSFAEIATVAAGVTTFSSTGLAAGTLYEYRVRAYNAAGSSAYSNTASATTESPAPVAPAAPSGLSAASISTSRIDLGWSDNSNDEDGFRIERRSGGGSFAEIATVAAGVTTFSSTGLAASTLYEYRVRAFNAAGASAYSNTASATTESPAPVAPAAPSGLTATAVSTSRIDLGWSDNSTDEDGFRIERRSGGGSFAEIATVAAGVTTFSSTGLAAGTLYEYRVRAYNAAGASAYSNTASATTESPAFSIVLVTSGYKDKGLHKALLTWSGATTPRVDIYRNGQKVATVNNTGTFTDHIDLRGSATYTHQVCEEGTSNCSATVDTSI